MNFLSFFQNFFSSLISMEIFKLKNNKENKLIYSGYFMHLFCTYYEAAIMRVTKKISS